GLTAHGPSVAPAPGGAAPAGQAGPPPRGWASGAPGTRPAARGAMTTPPRAGQPPLPSVVLPACTSQYDGIAFMTSNIGPEFASWNPYTPPTSASKTTTPPIAGASASAGTRYPTTIPSATNGASPARSRPVISSHC